MPKFIQITNCGYGDDVEVIEADDQIEAKRMAYDSWLQDAESNAKYEAFYPTKELIEDYGLEAEFEEGEVE